MLENKSFMIMILVTLLLAGAAVAFQVLEMNAYGLFQTLFWNCSDEKEILLYRCCCICSGIFIVCRLYPA